MVQDGPLHSFHRCGHRRRTAVGNCVMGVGGLEDERHPEANQEISIR